MSLACVFSQSRVPDGRCAEGLRLPGASRSSLLLVHGLTGTPAEMAYLAGFFNRKGYSVHVPCLANHGRHINVLKHTTWRECYASVREELARIPADGPLFVCGLSMGALLALLLACDLPSRLSGVAAISPTLFYDGWNIPWYRKFIPAAYAWPLRYVLYWKEDPPYGIKDAAMRRFIERQYREGGFNDTERARKYGYPYFPFSLLHQLSLLVRHITPRLGRIRVPVQVIQALEDDMTSIRNAQYIFDTVGSSMKELAVFGESYHVIPADRERETVAAKIAAFFDACGGCGEEREAVLHG